MNTKKTKHRQCPVCNYTIDSKTAPIKVGRRVFLVCCEDCERKVRANPEKYIAGR